MNQFEEITVPFRKKGIVGPVIFTVLIAIVSGPTVASGPDPLVDALDLRTDSSATLKLESLKTLRGETVNLGDTTEYTILNFWASWCEPCRKELADLDQLHEEYDPSNVRVVGVNVGETEATIQRYRQKQSLSFPIVSDHDQKIYDRFFDVIFLQLPATVLIRNRGRIVGRSTRLLNLHTSNLRDELNKLN